ncbi:MAG: bacterial transcriptional activator domain-containing protein [Pseudomonadota bacterium]
MIAARCLFVEEVQAHPLRFRFHPAFRAMLQAELHTLVDAGELAHLQETAAPMLEHAGCELEAASILANLADEQALADLLERRLPGATPGQDAQRWISFARDLSPAVASARPWIAYWQGRHCMWSGPVEAAAALADAVNVFTVRGDHVAATQALCALVEARYIDGAPEPELEALADALLCQLNVPALADAPATLRLHANACAALALSASRPRGKTIAQVVAATIALLDGAQAPAERLAAAAKLLPCTPWMPEGAAQALVMEGDAMVHAGNVPVDRGLAWCCASARWHAEYSGDLHAAELLVEAAGTLAKDLNAVVAERWLGAISTVLQLGRGATAQALLASRTAGAGASSKALAALAAGDLAAGLELAESACRSRAGLVRGAGRSRFEAQVATLCAASGALPQSEDWARRAVASACGIDASVAQDRQMLIAVWNHGSARREQADSVATILKRHHDRGLRAFFVVAPTLAARIAAFALNEGAQPQSIEAIIRRQGLVVPDRSCAQWPWPIRVRALGVLSIEIKGQLQPSTGKAQQRLLDLLRILAGAGCAGRSQQALEVAMWPDAESPKSAMAVAIHRLRKMLGRDDAVLVHAGNVVLNPEVVWTDIEAFKDLCTATEQLSARAGTGQAERLAAQLAGVYRGTFYEGDADPWLVAVRSRLCASFVTCATTLGATLEAHDRWEAAGVLYRRVLEAQPLCETAYRGLMRCAHAQGDFGAAFSFYRFCRDTLSIILNCEPSPETRRLAVMLGLGGVHAASHGTAMSLRSTTNALPAVRAA